VFFGTDRRRGVRLAAVLSVVAAALAIPATTQAWTAGTDGAGNLVVQNDVPAEGDFFYIGFMGGVYEIDGITGDAHVFGDCAVTTAPNVVQCSPTGITHIVYTGSADGEVVWFDFVPPSGDGSPISAPLPDGVSTRVHTHAGLDSVLGSHNRDVLDEGAGNDFLHGERGGDKIIGGSGKDIMWGDWGRDLLLAQDGMADAQIDCGPGLDHPAVFDLGLDPAPVDCG
jgi:Ca2+-binding RTX toxin-like protein